jgi:hypothetical protein
LIRLTGLRILGDITYVPITSTKNAASRYWGIDQQVTYDGQTILSSAGIVDTGTTLVLLASDAFNAYKQATGGEMDQYVVTTAPISFLTHFNLQSNWPTHVH